MFIISYFAGEDALYKLGTLHTYAVTRECKSEISYKKVVYDAS